MKKQNQKLNQVATKVLEQMLAGSEGKAKVKILKELVKRGVVKF